MVLPTLEKEKKFCICSLPFSAWCGFVKKSEYCIPGSSDLLPKTSGNKCCFGKKKKLKKQANQYKKQL